MSELQPENFEFPTPCLYAHPQAVCGLNQWFSLEGWPWAIETNFAAQRARSTWEFASSKVDQPVQFVEDWMVLVSQNVGLSALKAGQSQVNWESWLPKVPSSPQVSGP